MDREKGWKIVILEGLILGRLLILGQIRPGLRFFQNFLQFFSVIGIGVGIAIAIETK